MIKGCPLALNEGRRRGYGEQSIHHTLKYLKTTCKAMSNLHARPAFSSSSETETVNLLLTQNRTW